MLFAGEVNANPNPHSNEPANATLRYENSFNSGPTNSPEKFMHTSKVLIIIAAPVVPTSSSVKRSPNRRPNDGSIDLVANYKKRMYFSSGIEVDYVLRIDYELDGL